MAGFVAVHTGAGNCMDESKYQKVIKEACIRATNILKNGGTSLDACEAAIVRLENSGNTNAGFGSNLTWDGTIECEASIMDGTSLNFGACTNVTIVKNPIQLARVICERQSKMLSLERIPPMILAGEGAVNYAKNVGVQLVESETILISSKAQRCHEHYMDKVAKFENLNCTKLNPLDTVGAVVVDGKGNCTSGCSSGGLILKLSGRVGQAATYGAGCWAQDTDSGCVATCTTGNGEYLIKSLLAKEIGNGLLNSTCPAVTLHQVFKEKFLESPFLPKNKELFGGALSLVYDPKSFNGEVLWCHTTKSLCLGYMSTFQKTPKFIHSSLPTYIKPGESIVVNGHTFKLPI